MDVVLTPELERFARACVESGRFSNVSEVVKSGLRLLQEAELRRAAFVASLEEAREEGVREGFASIEEVEADVGAAIEAARDRSKRHLRFSPRGRAESSAKPPRG